MAQRLFQNLNWEALPVQEHHKFADIIIRQQLELTNSASMLTQTQDIGMQFDDFISLICVSMAAFPNMIAILIQTGPSS